ncbi:tail fiber protein, partial [bacterium]|nr:tail fiber protein [bacterium]
VTDRNLANFFDYEYDTNTITSLKLNSAFSTELGFSTSFFETAQSTSIIGNELFQYSDNPGFSALSIVKQLYGGDSAFVKTLPWVTTPSDYSRTPIFTLVAIGKFGMGYLLGDIKLSNSNWNGKVNVWQLPQLYRTPVPFGAFCDIQIPWPYDISYNFDPDNPSIVFNPYDDVSGNWYDIEESRVLSCSLQIIASLCPTAEINILPMETSTTSGLEACQNLLLTIQQIEQSYADASGNFPPHFSSTVIIQHLVDYAPTIDFVDASGDINLQRQILQDNSFTLNNQFIQDNLKSRFFTLSSNQYYGSYAFPDPQTDIYGSLGISTRYFSNCNDQVVQVGGTVMKEGAQGLDPENEIIYNSNTGGRYSIVNGIFYNIKKCINDPIPSQFNTSPGCLPIVPDVAVFAGPYSYYMNGKQATNGIISSVFSVVLFGALYGIYSSVYPSSSFVADNQQSLMTYIYPPRMWVENQKGYLDCVYVYPMYRYLDLQSNCSPQDSKLTCQQISDNSCYCNPSQNDTAQRNAYNNAVGNGVPDFNYWGVDTQNTYTKLVSIGKKVGTIIDNIVQLSQFILNPIISWDLSKGQYLICTYEPMTQQNYALCSINIPQAYSDSIPLTVSPPNFQTFTSIYSLFTFVFFSVGGVEFFAVIDSTTNAISLAATPQLSYEKWQFVSVQTGLFIKSTDTQPPNGVYIVGYNSSPNLLLYYWYWDPTKNSLILTDNKLFATPFYLAQFNSASNPTATFEYPSATFYPWCGIVNFFQFLSDSEYLLIGNGDTGPAWTNQIPTDEGGNFNFPPSWLLIPTEISSQTYEPFGILLNGDFQQRFFIYDYHVKKFLDFTQETTIPSFIYNEFNYAQGCFSFASITAGDNYCLISFTNFAAYSSDGTFITYIPPPTANPIIMFDVNMNKILKNQDSIIIDNNTTSSNPNIYATVISANKAFGQAPSQNINFPYTSFVFLDSTNPIETYIPTNTAQQGQYDFNVQIARPITFQNGQTSSAYLKAFIPSNSGPNYGINIVCNSPGDFYKQYLTCYSPDDSKYQPSFRPQDADGTDGGKMLNIWTFYQHFKMNYTYVNVLVYNIEFNLQNHRYYQNVMCSLAGSGKFLPSMVPLNDSTATAYYVTPVLDYQPPTVLTLPIGIILPTLSSTPFNEDYILCDGRELNINDYPSYYQLIKNTVYDNNNNTTFVLPDFGCALPAVLPSSLKEPLFGKDVGIGQYFGEMEVRKHWNAFYEEGSPFIVTDEPKTSCQKVTTVRSNYAVQIGDLQSQPNESAQNITDYLPPYLAVNYFIKVQTKNVFQGIPSSSFLFVNNNTKSPNLPTNSIPEEQNERFFIGTGKNTKIPTIPFDLKLGEIGGQSAVVPHTHPGVQFGNINEAAGGLSMDIKIDYANVTTNEQQPYPNPGGSGDPYQEYPPYEYIPTYIANQNISDFTIAYQSNLVFYSVVTDLRSSLFRPIQLKDGKMYILSTNDQTSWGKTGGELIPKVHTHDIINIPKQGFDTIVLYGTRKMINSTPSETYQLGTTGNEDLSIYPPSLTVALQQLYLYVS